MTFSVTTDVPQHSNLQETDSNLQGEKVEHFKGKDLQLLSVSWNGHGLSLRPLFFFESPPLFISCPAFIPFFLCLNKFCLLYTYNLLSALIYMV